MAGCRWTPEEDAALIEMSALGYSDDEIAQKLGKTSKQAVWHRRSRIDAGPKEPRRSRITTAQVEAIARAREAGWTWERIASYSGRDPELLARAWRRVVKAGDAL